MKFRILCYAVALSCVVLPSVAWAEEVMLFDGHTVTGTVLETSEKGIRVKAELPGGGASTYDIAVTGLDPHWFYAVRNSALKDDAEGRAKLAIWAFENGLFNRARAQYAKVQKLDPEVAERYKTQVVPGLRAGIADKMVANAKRLSDDGQYADAKSILAKVITALGDTEAATQARAMMPGLQQRISKSTRSAETTLARDANEQTKADHEEAKRLIRPVRDKVNHAQHIENRALSSEHSSASLSSFSQAAREFQHALDQIESLRKHHATNAGLMQDLASYERLAQKGWIECHANRVQIFLSRGDHQHARTEHKKIEKFAKDSPQAAQLASEIESAQAAGGESWYWQGDHAFGGRGGRRRR